jgi:hypothetical protein
LSSIGKSESALTRGIRDGLQWIESWKSVVLSVLISALTTVVAAASDSAGSSSLHTVTRSAIAFVLTMMTYFSLVLLTHVVNSAPRRQRNEARETVSKLRLETVALEDQMVLGLECTGPDFRFADWSRNPSLADVQVGVNFRNKSPGPLTYQIESLSVAIDGYSDVASPVSGNPEFLAIDASTQIFCPWMQGIDEGSGAYEGVIEFVVKFGYPLQDFSYRSHRKLRFRVNVSIAPSGVISPSPRRHRNWEFRTMEQSEERISHRP